MSEWLFNVSWWLIAVVAVVAAAIAYVGNLRQQKPLRTLGLVALLVAAIWGVLNAVVVTDMEHVQRGTRQLVTHVHAGEWDRFRQQLAPSAQLRAGNVIYADADEFRRGAQASTEMIGLQSVTLIGTEYRRTGASTIEAHITTYSEQSRYPYPTTTYWRLDWRKSDGEWRISTIESVTSVTGNVTPDRVRENLVRLGGGR